MNELLKDICNRWGVSLKEIQSSSRRREVVIPRQLFCYIVRKKWGDPAKFPYYSLKRIGLMLNKDHATVLHSARVIEQDVKAGNKVYLHRQDRYVDIREEVNAICDFRPEPLGVRVRMHV